MKTNFLDYIKYKVTESPAIYFVVDVENKIIFWLYLSDEVLMNLDYDGKPKVPYAFSEENILFDVSKFTSVLNHIVQERNKAFLNKTESEISEMQDALDYINHHLDFDFKVIKDTVFPNLWRFGIRCSDNPEISIGFGQGKERIPVSSAVALYPQMKGKNDSGIQEYVTDYENLFNKLSLGKKEDLAIYSQKTLHEIIKLFFELGIPPHYLPDLVLLELIDVFVKKSNSLWKAEIKLPLDEVTRRYAVLMQYINHIILDDTIDDAENEFRQVLRSQLYTRRFRCLDIIQAISTYGLRSSFIEYQKNTHDNLALELKPQIAVIVASDYIVFYKVLIELKERGVSSVDYVWDYNWNQIIGMNRNEQHNKIEMMMKQWLGSLSELYKDACTRLSLNLDFSLRHRYAFNILSNDFKVSYIYKKYLDDKLSFIYDHSIDKDSIIFGSVEEGLISRTQSAELEKIFQHYTPPLQRPLRSSL